MNDKELRAIEYERERNEKRTTSAIVKMVNAVLDVWENVDDDIAADAMVSTIELLTDELSAFVAMDELRARRPANTGDEK